MLILIHPVFAMAFILLAFGVATLGWRYRFTRAPGSAGIHVRMGKIFLGALGVVWLGGLLGVVIARVPGIQPAASGHFALGTTLLAGYGFSAALMLRWGKVPWIRRLHFTANTLLLGLVAYQGLMGINRLYKFGVLSPVPQDQKTRSLLVIKFGLQSPPVTAAPGQAYTWASPGEGQTFGGDWRTESNAITQADCGCSGNVVWDWLTVSNRFPLLVFDAPVFGDFDYSAEFLIESGQVDQYAGLAFRIVNENNYYVARASVSEQSVTLARFNNGSRQVFYSFPATVKLGAWQTLRVSVSGARVKIALDDQVVGEAEDDGWLTGRVGMGTKSDSVARFRNMRVVER